MSKGIKAAILLVNKSKSESEDDNKRYKYFDCVIEFSNKEDVKLFKQMISNRTIKIFIKKETE